MAQGTPEDRVRVLIERDELAQAAVAALHRSPSLTVELSDVRPAHRAFRGFLGDQPTLDVSELAIVTLLQAAAYEKPIVLLPVTTLSRHQHRTLVTRKDLDIGELVGATVGVRSWSQTTGVWMRGILTTEAGIDLRAVDWVVYEPGHIAEQADPPWVRRASPGDELTADFLNGDLDYAIFGNEIPADQGVHPAIARADEAARIWSERHGFIPVNHVMAATATAARSHAEALCQMYDAMRSLPVATDCDTRLAGFGALRAPFTLIAEWALDQEVLPRRVAFDELLAASCEALGVPPSRLGG